MIIPKEYPSKDVLERIADDYRRRGYVVSVEPGDKDLPTFLAGDTPDIIAHRGEEHLVIEVKHSPKDVDPKQTNAIAERIARQPGWKFVLLAIPKMADLKHATLETIDEQSVRRKLAEAKSLLDAGHLEAAVMLAWAATEAVIRLLVVSNGLRISRGDAASLIRLLVSEGIIEEDAFRHLLEGLDLRNAVAHGVKVLPKDSTDGVRATNTLLGLADLLLRELAKA